MEIMRKPRPYKTTIGFSEEAWDLITENKIDNLSGYIDYLVVEEFQNKKFWKKLALKSIEEARLYAQKAGLEIEIQIKKEAAE